MFAVIGKRIKETAKDLDFWVNKRFFWWLQGRHRLPARRIMSLYKHREDGRRYNLGIRDGDDTLFLYRMSDQPITKYRSRRPGNPYLSEDWVTEIEGAESPLSENNWLGNKSSNEEWRESKTELKALRNTKAQHNSATMGIDLPSPDPTM